MLKGRIKMKRNQMNSWTSELTAEIYVHKLPIEIRQPRELEPISISTFTTQFRSFHIQCIPPAGTRSNLRLQLETQKNKPDWTHQSHWSISLSFFLSFFLFLFCDITSEIVVFRGRVGHALNPAGNWMTKKEVQSTASLLTSSFTNIEALSRFLSRSISNRGYFLFFFSILLNPLSWDHSLKSERFNVMYGIWCSLDGFSDSGCHKIFCFLRAKFLQLYLPTENVYDYRSSGCS